MKLLNIKTKEIGFDTSFLGLAQTSVTGIISTLSFISIVGITQQPVKAFQIDTTDDNGLNGQNKLQIYDTFYQNGVSATQTGVNGTPTLSYGGTHDLGNFALIGELSQNTGLGNILEVLVYNNSTGNNGEVSNSGTIASLAETLSQTGGGDGIPVYNTTSLVLGLGVNETGNAPTFGIDILEFKVQIPGSGCTSETITVDTTPITAPTCTFSFGSINPVEPAVTVIASGGNNSSEARVQMDLDPYLQTGEDFLSTYNYLNPDNTLNTTTSNIADEYYYSVSSIANDSAGNDRFFLSSGLTEFAEDVSLVEEVPFKFSPGLGLILGGSLLGFLRLQKKLKANNIN